MYDPIYDQAQLEKEINELLLDCMRLGDLLGDSAIEKRAGDMRERYLKNRADLRRLPIPDDQLHDVIIRRLHSIITQGPPTAVSSAIELLHQYQPASRPPRLPDDRRIDAVIDALEVGIFTSNPQERPELLRLLHEYEVARRPPAS